MLQCVPPYDVTIDVQPYGNPSYCIAGNFHQLPTLTKLISALHFVGIQVLVQAGSEVAILNCQRNDFGNQVAKSINDENYLPYSTTQLR